MHGGAAASRRMSLQARAVLWLSRREHSRAELRRKLMRVARAELARETPDANPQEAAALAGQRVDAALAWLQAERLQSDLRFAESRVHARAARFGNQRIRSELAQHEVALAPELAQQLNANEADRARELLARRFGAAPCSMAERARRARFLAGRGFGAEVVSRVLREFSAAQGEAEDACADFD